MLCGHRSYKLLKDFAPLAIKMMICKSMLKDSLAFMTQSRQFLTLILIPEVFSI